MGDDTDPGGIGCSGTPVPAYPWATGGPKAWDGSPSITFEMQANGGVRVPRGVWFVEGNHASGQLIQRRKWIESAW